MKTLIAIVSLTLFLISCQSNQKNSEETIIKEVDLPASEWAKEEEEVKRAAEELLFHVGNYNHEAMAAMSLPDANVGMAGSGASMTLQQYFDLVTDRETLIPYYEPPHKYTIVISEGKLAFVRAECFMYRFGVKQSFEDDFFTFIKSGDDWKLLSASYTAKRFPVKEQVFDLEAFAKSYAQVWGSNHPEFVGMFFAENGSLGINEDEPAIGRDQIAHVAQSFMTDLPDMRVTFDSLVNEPDRLEFFWTLTATHDKTGNKINVSGSEEWTLSSDNFIQKSQGHFPTDQYNQQIGATK